MSDTFSRLSAALADRYRLERELGAGGMATVYLAHDVKHERRVAVKVLRPELAAVLGAERFVQEIKTTASLQHPHILPLFDSGEAGGFLFYVMPYIEGETLRDRLNREHQLGIDEAVRLTTAVADALHYAHRQGVIHRDIKPENILLHDGRPMVADFGIALAVSAAAGGRMTETGLSLGTPHYMSPEQATAEKEISARSDVYSLASVLYEMLTGEPPHTGGSAQAIIMKIVTDTARPVTELRKSVPPGVAAATAKALEKLPADRFASAAEFAAALENPTFATAASAATVGGRAVPPAGRSVLTTAFAAATVLAAALAAWGWLRPAGQPGVARYRHAFPSGQELRDYPTTQFAWAPDGAWLVYTGPGAEAGEDQLWVKPRDRAEAAPLPGTEGGVAPSVSPDGQWVAFSVGSQLRRVPAGGGAATTIADSLYAGAGGSAAVWSGNGTLVYLDAERRLRSVPAAGGVREVLFAPQAGRWAVPIAALADGRGILFLHCSNSCDPVSELWVLDGRSGEAKQLLPDASGAWYRDGKLLFTRRDGGGFVVPFDLGTLALDGAPMPLFEGVRVDYGAHVALSASGTLAYLTGQGSGGLWESVWVSRDGRAVPVDTAWTFIPSANFGSALSPDGTRLAVALLQGGMTDVWIKELDRGPLSRLTIDDAESVRPGWTPDGRTVTFTSNRADDGDWDLYRRSADGTGADSLLVDLEESIWEVRWSRDARWMILRTGGRDGGRNIWAMEVGRDTVPRPLLRAPYDETAPALSPDGRWLAYVSDETGRFELFVRPFPDVDSGKWQVSRSGARSPVWAHSGRALFFIDDDRALVSQAVGAGAGGAFQRGEQRTLFTLGSGVFTNPVTRSFDVSPDDQRFLMVQRHGGSEVAEAPILMVAEHWLDEVERALRR